MTKARYIMIGGFLGAGKTTRGRCKLAEQLTARGLRVGLITNDQSSGLVDTAMLAIARLCRRRKSPAGASAAGSIRWWMPRTSFRPEPRPDVFIAEPVGSCTDLKASVSYPLRRMYGDDFSIAPLSVLVDPIRALRILGLEAGQGVLAERSSTSTRSSSRKRS